MANQTTTGTGTDTVTRHCIRCGKGDDEVEFRSPLALKCLGCDAEAVEEKRAYHKRYHAARHRAVQALIGKHPKQFKDLMDKALGEDGGDAGHGDGEPAPLDDQGETS